MLAQLDTKTVYTFMDSMVTIKEYIARAKEMGYTHLGIMDVNQLYGAYTFMEACRLAGIQPIIGCEVTVLVEQQAVTVQLIARNTNGYRQLMKLSTVRMMGKENWADLATYVTPDLAVIVPFNEQADQLPLGVDYYLGVTQPVLDRELQHPILAMHTVRYFQEQQVEVLQVLHAIRDNSALNQVATIPLDQTLLVPSDLTARFAAQPQALTNLENLVSGISYELSYELKLPRFNPARPAVEELRERAEAGLVEKKLTASAYQERLTRELAVIHQMGFDDYFLIVWDLLRFGRSQGYYMGMGRGSAAGSLVAYALNITGIDPVKNNLLFERFLNEERYSMPDIDIDMPDIYRSEFIRYVRDRYGSYHSAQIVTYSTFGAKQALRDVLKRFGAPEYELTNITKKIAFHQNLQTAYDQNASFRQIIGSKMEYQKAYQIALQIEGIPRQTSIHAAGVVMSDEDLTDTIPLKMGEDMFITQYDAHAVEANGLLKMDFLGLRNLTFAQKMEEAIRRRYDEQFRMAEVDLEDKDTIALFAAGKTKGIFQFEQPGAIRLLKQVQPTSFEDIVATTSLNRPGASDYASNFVKRKHGQEAVEVLDASIAPILAPTYGIMLYQEQVMQIAQIFAGFTLGKADILRRAMGKKDPAVMHQMEDQFIDGAVAQGHTPEQARMIFDRIEKFAGYGFNRSHAYAYSALAFQLAYVKVHFSDVFFEVMLNYSNADYVTDALQFGYQVSPLSINTIQRFDRFYKGKIYLGLKNIKGMPMDLIEWMTSHQPFASVEEFVRTLPIKYRKEQVLAPLIKLGLFDEFGHNRHTVLENLDNLFTYAEAFDGLFGQDEFAWIEQEDFSQLEKFEMEKELVGVGLSEHPLKKIQRENTRPVTDIANLVVGERATLLVQIQDIRVIRTKTKGELMAFIQVTDTQKTLDVTAFPETYQQLQELLQVSNMLYLSGRVQERNQQVQLIVDTAEPAQTEKCWLLLADHSHDQEIAAILQEHKGTIPVILHYQDSNQTVQLPHILVQKSDSLLENLSQFVMKTVFR